VSDDETRQLLKEIRDTQRELLAEYRKTAERAIELQQRAVARQEQAGRVARRILLVGGVLFVSLLGLLFYLLVKFSRPLFGV